jgi:hypothetical protein
MNLVNRRRLLPILALGFRLEAQSAKVSVRGKLTAAGDGTPALDEPARGRVLLAGDPPTVGVLKDHRLAGSDFEAIGAFRDDRVFQVDPIHLRAMFVHRNDRRLFVTYWCDVCSIRFYTPGICWCCQQESALDLREKDDS